MSCTEPAEGDGAAPSFSEKICISCDGGRIIWRLWVQLIAVISLFL